MLVAWLALALSDRAGAAAHAGPVFSLSLIHHHLLICSALFTSIVSFHHCPASQRLSHRCLPRTLMHLRSVLPPHITTFDPNSFSLLSQTRLCSLGLSGAIFQDAPSMCLFFFFFTATASRDPGDVEPGLSFGRGALTENFRESLSGGRQWGKEGIDGGWWIPVPCLRLTVGSTLKLPHRGEEC